MASKRSRTALLLIDFINDLDYPGARTLAAPALRAALADAIRPEQDDYFVLKPRNSAFFQTPLAVLLEDLGARRLVLAGLTADNCVLFTANDAHLRGFEIVVASDCVASIRPGDRASALKHMAAVDHARVQSSRAVRWQA